MILLLSVKPRFLAAAYFAITTGLLTQPHFLATGSSSALSSLISTSSSPSISTFSSSSSSVSSSLSSSFSPLSLLFSSPAASSILFCERVTTPAPAPDEIQGVAVICFSTWRKSVMVAKVVFLCPRLQCVRRYWIASVTYFPTAAGVILSDRRLIAPNMFSELSPASKV